MTIPPERWLLDTNIWVFGLRRNPSIPTCEHLLDRIGSFVVVVPLQVLKELNVNLREDEIRGFYRLIKKYPTLIELSWTIAPVERVKFYEQRGCRKGDAVIAAHAESLEVEIIISENRQFLQTMTDISLKIITSAVALSRLE
ncbi:MAG TPA: type II toxin-antitoxin system VapC family toxin [Pyrinomonadaceae bacterium]|nr:type II toxin-antitoxin system VapC family toxin [Pyrinomonadaceae bacterium]